MSDEPTNNLIDVARDGDIVTVLFDTRLKVDKPIINFRWKCENEIFAEILRQRLHDQLTTTIKNIRMVAYVDGWYDHRLKKKKKCLFSTRLVNVGYTGV